MATIVIEPAPLLRATSEGELDALVGDLEAQGHRVTLRSAPERRDLGQAAADLAVHVLDALEAHVIDAIIAAATARLVTRRRRERPRRAVIYGPNGEVLREVDIRARDAGD